MSVGSPRVSIRFHHVELGTDSPPILATTVVITVGRIWFAIAVDGGHPHEVEGRVASTVCHRQVFVVLERASEELRLEVSVRVYAIIGVEER